MTVPFSPIGWQSNEKDVTTPEVPTTAAERPVQVWVGVCTAVAS